jgi:hypothetical protein
MPSEQSSLPFWLCTCALLIFLVAAGFSPSLGAGSPANLECGKDVGCFVKAFDERTPATVRQVTTISNQGITITSSSYWETRAFTGDKCTLYIRLEALKGSVDETAMRQAQASIASAMKLSKQVQETALKAMETDMKQSIEEEEHHVGHDATCVFQTEKLKPLIAQWQKGELEAWSKKAENCQGALLGEDEGSVSLASSVQVSAPPVSPPAVPPSPPASVTGDITSNTKVTPFYEDGTQFQFKPEEKRAFLFIWSINDLEHSCKFHLQSQTACPLDKLVKGFPVKGSPTPVGLSQDPRQEKDYDYVVTVSGPFSDQWAVAATPRRSGLGGFFDDGHAQPTDAPGTGAGLHFNPAGPATKNDKIIKGAFMEGPTFLRRH